MLNKRTQAQKPKHYFHTLLLCLYILLSCSTIKYLPGMLLIQDIYTGLILLFLSLILPWLILTKQHRLSRLEVYGLLVVAVIPIVNVYMSNVEFGQPIFYGALANRGLALIGCSILLVVLVNKKLVTLFDIEKSLLWLAWLSLISFTLANIFVDPNQLDDQAGFSSEGTGEGGKLIFDTSFIVYGFFYYAFVKYGSTAAKKNHVYYALPFLAYLLFISGGRMTFVAVVLTYTILVTKWRSLSESVFSWTKMIVLVTPLIILLTLFPPKSLIDFETRMLQAVDVVLTGKEGEDYSANARIYEINLALPYIEKNTFLGNGYISNQWRDGFKGVVGYFHPTDIGFYGVLYIYGVFGLLLFSGQIFFLLKYGQQIPVHAGPFSRLSNSVKAFMLFILVTSLSMGRYVFLVEQSFLFISILYCISLTVHRQPQLRGRN